MSSPSSVISIDELSESDIGSMSGIASNGEQPSRVPTPSGVDAAVKHPRFYYEDGSFEFMADGVLFRVHRSVFASLSQFWSGKLQSLPASLDEPYKVDEASSEDIASFLSIVYPRVFSAHEVKTVAEWRAVLRVATKWQFEAVQELALQQLDYCVQPMERLFLARTYGLSGWLEQAFVDCITREKLPAPEEMRDLDLTLVDFAHIATAREDIARGRLSADPQLVLRHVQENILSSVPATFAGGNDKFHYLVRSTAQSPTQAPSFGRSAIPTRNGCSPQPKVVPTTPPSVEHTTQKMTPDVHLSPSVQTPAAVIFSYVPYTIEERDRVNNWRNCGYFEHAFETVTSDNVLAFCETLTAHHISNYKDALLKELNARVACIPEFYHAGVYIARYVLETFKSELQDNPQMKHLARVFSQVNDLNLISNDDKTLSVLDYLASDLINTPKFYVTGCIGSQGFLACHPDLFKQRVKRLKAYMVTLVDGGLIRIV